VRVELDRAQELAIRTRAKAAVEEQLGWTKLVLAGSAGLLSAAIALIAMAMAVPQLPRAYAIVVAALIGIAAGALAGRVTLQRAEPLLPMIYERSDKGTEPESRSKLLSMDASSLPTPPRLPSPRLSSEQQPAPRLPSPTLSSTVGEQFLSVRWWLYGRWLVVLPMLILLPIVIYHDDLKSLASLWWTPLMGTIAAAIASGGAPVAGGIVFLPVLTHLGVCPSDAVAFTAATQMLGVGVFAPLNWLVRDPSAIDLSSLRRMLPPMLVGLILSLTVLRLESGDAVLIAFAFFCLFVAAYVAQGLLGCGTGPMSELSAVRTEPRMVLHWAACALGGLLTGYIGVAAEKVSFMLLIYQGGIDVRTASVTSVTSVGWLSAVATVVHALSRCSSGGYDLPVQLWLTGLPGILLGSYLGPRINAALGPRRVMTVFCVLLVVEAVCSLSRALAADELPCSSQCAAGNAALLSDFGSGA